MDIKLQEKLFKKYPKIFAQRNLPPNKTCMCFGIETGNGWYHLIDNLCSCIQFHIDHNDYSQIQATQVKEKFGGLRFYNTIVGDYILGKHEYIQGMIDFAESLSSETCETCGSTKEVSQTEGWVRTICKKCLNESLSKREK